MARARKAEEERSMDSLMDAMTNVVGILLLILIVSSLGISAAVKKVIDSLPQVTEEEYERMKVSRENMLENLQKLRQTQTDTEKNQKTEEEAKQLALELEEFEKNNKDLTDKTSDIEEWRRRVTDQETKKTEKDEKVKVAAAELANLRAILDQTPEREVKDATLVKMPNPRLAPQEARAFYAVCKNQKLYFVGDPYDHVFSVAKAIEDNFTKLAFTGEGIGSFTYPIVGTKQNDARTGYLPLDETVRRTSRMDKDYAAWEAVKIVEFSRAGAEPNYTYTVNPEKGMLTRLFGNVDRREFQVHKFRLDEGKVKAFFGDGKLGPKDFKYFVVRNGTTDRLKLSLGFKEEGGLSIEQFKARNSPFEQALKTAQVSRGSLVYFYVAPDSFNVYLAAREMSETLAILAGWTTFTGDVLELKAMSLRETISLNVGGLPAAEYRKIADTAGQALAAKLKDEVENFDAKVAAAVPKEMTDPAEKAKFIAALTAERKDWIYRNLQPWVRAIYESAFAVAEVNGDKQVRIDVHPPEIPFTRLFTGSPPPSAPKPPPDPNAPKPKPRPAAPPGTRLILD
ncbi:MAG: hypothetical protein KDM91_01280 [Verrucomicrobiae bacterium]|nr:hypothetical protein [Verrucomicrobiae bacterium]MCP5542052.1 hypothetical protein [Akkermansiaceae bacterium]MCP5551030.1 hypothetical protein [Akkermansiaceae bacterium]